MKIKLNCIEYDWPKTAHSATSKSMVAKANHEVSPAWLRKTGGALGQKTQLDLIKTLFDPQEIDNLFYNQPWLNALFHSPVL